jgi:hypothetical protein
MPACAWYGHDAALPEPHAGKRYSGHRITLDHPDHFLFQVLVALFKLGLGRRVAISFRPCKAAMHIMVILHQALEAYIAPGQGPDNRFVIREPVYQGGDCLFHRLGLLFFQSVVEIESRRIHLILH